MRKGRVLALEANDGGLKDPVGDAAHKENAPIRGGRDRCEMGFTEPGGYERGKGKPKQKEEDLTFNYDL